MPGPLKSYGWDNDAHEVKPSNKHPGGGMVTSNGAPMTHHFTKSIAEALCALDRQRDGWGPPYPLCARGRSKEMSI